MAIAGYTVNVSAVEPLAQNITQAGDDLLDEQGNPHLLIQPVVQVSPVTLFSMLGSQPALHSGI